MNSGTQSIVVTEGRKRSHGWFYCKDEFLEIEVRWDRPTQQVRIIDFKHLAIVNESGIPLSRLIHNILREGKSL